MCDFTAAATAASFALYCECEPQTALKRLSPNAEWMESLRGTVTRSRSDECGKAVVGGG